jgi:hypothetical protein
MPRVTASRRSRRAWVSHAFRPPEAKPLLRAVDNGPAVRLNPLHFAPAQRDRGWGAFVESFIRANELALARLDCRVDVAGGVDGAVVRIKPGGHTGAVPLRSAQTQSVVGGFVVVPRFEWAGVGRVLQQTGWAAAPEFLDLPLVPGSGRFLPGQSSAAWPSCSEPPNAATATRTKTSSAREGGSSGRIHVWTDAGWEVGHLAVPLLRPRGRPQAATLDPVGPRAGANRSRKRRGPRSVGDASGPRSDALAAVYC